MNRFFLTEGNKGAISHPRALLKALGVSMVFTLTAFIIFSVIITYSGLCESASDTIVAVITLAAVALCGFTAAKNAFSRGWLWGALGGIAYILTVKLAGAVFNGNSDIGLNTLFAFLISGVIGAVGGIVGINVKASPSHN